MANLEIFSNFAVSSFLGAIASGDTTLQVQVADAAKFPTPSVNQQFRLVLAQANTGLKEVVFCTARASNTLTITRAQEGTAALAFAVGDIVAHRLTAGALQTLFTNSGVAPATPTWVAVGSGGAAPAFQNGWINFGAPYETASYAVDYLGFVHLRGTIKSGTVTLTIFTLPVGFRPLKQRIFAANSNGAHGMVEVMANGNVQLTVGSNVSASLDGMNFFAEQ